jgi:uncharacterized protein YdaU (DUF1376 family)
MSLPKFQVYYWSVTDWRNDDVYKQLSTEEKGAYRELIDECWLQERIPNDPQRLARIAGVSDAAFAVLWKVIGHKFIAIDNGDWLTSRRLEEERQKKIAADAQKVAAANIGVAKRRQKSSGKPAYAERTLPKTAEKSSETLKTVETNLNSTSSTPLYSATMKAVDDVNASPEAMLNEKAVAAIAHEYDLPHDVAVLVYLTGQIRHAIAKPVDPISSMAFYRNLAQEFRGTTVPRGYLKHLTKKLFEAQVWNLRAPPS